MHFFSIVENVEVVCRNLSNPKTLLNIPLALNIRASQLTILQANLQYFCWLSRSPTATALLNLPMLLPASLHGILDFHLCCFLFCHS